MVHNKLSGGQDIHAGTREKWFSGDSVAQHSQLLSPFFFFFFKC